MKLWLKYTVAALGLYCVFLIATIPAHLVTSKLTLPQNVQLGNVSGTLWSGRFDRVIVDGIELKNTQWSFAFRQLFLGRLAVDFNFGSTRKQLEPYGMGTAYTGLSGQGLVNSIIKVSAHVINDKVPSSVVDNVAGLVTLKLDKASLGEPYCTELEGQLTWAKSGLTAMGGEFNLGQLNAQLACKEGKLALTAKGDEKTLILNANIELAAKNKVTLSGTIKAGALADKSLVSALSFLGKADEQGRYTLQYSN